MTMVKSSKFQALRRYAVGCCQKPYAMIFMMHSEVKITKNIYSTFSKIRFISLVSSAGNGVYTASATQLPIIVIKIRNSKGFHSTTSRNFLRMGFFKPKQKIARGARSGGGLAPIR